MKGYEEIIKRITALEEHLLSGIIKPMNLMETAAYLGLSPSYIYKLTHKHLIPHYKPTGKRVFFYKKELDEWIMKSNCDTSASLSACLGIENGELEKTKDPHQIEMELEEKKSKKACVK